MPERNSGNHFGCPTPENPQPEKSVAKSVAATGFPRRVAVTNQLLARGKSYPSTLDEAATVEQGSQLAPSQCDSILSEQCEALVQGFAPTGSKEYRHPKAESSPGNSKPNNATTLTMSEAKKTSDFLQSPSKR